MRKIYFVLLGILGILIIAVGLYSAKKQSVSNQIQTNTPKPTSFLIVPTSSSGKIVLTPRFTGANPDVPSPVLNLAIEKQTLKKKLPLTENGFTITYDYQTDLFVVSLFEPKQDNKIVFEQWLKQFYPLIPLNKFLLK